MQAETGQALETPLLSTGSYGGVRHPMYRAFILIGLSSIVIHPHTAQLFWAIFFGGTFLVWVPVETQLERTMQRDGCERGEAERRIAAQLLIDEKREMADHIIDNSGDREAAKSEVAALYKLLTEEAP